MAEFELIPYTSLSTYHTVKLYHLTVLTSKQNKPRGKVPYGASQKLNLLLCFHLDTQKKKSLRVCAPWQNSNQL